MTIGHRVFRASHGARGEPVEVSGRAVPFSVAAVAPVDLTEPCPVLVLFRPTCPYCGQAAATEAERSSIPLPVTWIAENEAEAQPFMDRVHAAWTVTWSGLLFRELQIQGVPAGFLLAEGTVVRAWRYGGNEQAAELLEGCAV